MAHYDCSNCGAGGGISFGSCQECTPKEIFEAQVALNRAHLNAERRWNDAVEELRREFLQKQTAEAHAAFNATWNIHAPERLRKP